MNVDLPLKCKLCSFSTGSLKTFTSHFVIHSNSANANFPCGVAQCTRTFRNYGAFKSHVYRHHGQYRTSADVYKCQAVDLKCSVPLCQFVCKGFANFLVHLKMHLRNSVSIRCPFKNCERHFVIVSTFTSHISRSHRGWKVTDICPGISSSAVLDTCGSTSGYETVIATTSMDSGNASDNTVHETPEECAIDDETYVDAIARFYMRLQAKLLLPVSAVQDIITEFQKIHDLGNDVLTRRLSEHLNSVGVPEETIKGAVNFLTTNDMFQKCTSGVLRSNQTRQTFFKSRFSIIEPQTIYLGQDVNGESQYSQYVPIKQTLVSLFNDGSVLKQYSETRQTRCDHHCFSDICDGKVFKRHRLFDKDASALRILLYQDSFEVVNPLGSGRRKHKILAVYMTLADILPHNRSTVDQIQLVLLCREADFKYFGHKAVFSPIIKDLRDIEENGLHLALLQLNPVKGALLAVVGDNLGSHCIGGFTENFSSSRYFCRYCLLTREEFLENPCRIGTLRTEENYDEAVHNRGQSCDEQFGIKFQSEFNELEFYHVCNPGLPPCLGHDLFEGVVGIDVALIIQHFVKVDKYFSYDHLNRLIMQFQYLGHDADSKPVEIKHPGKQLGGHAAQNWCLLRMLPIIIGDRIADIDNPVWNLFLLLKRIVELICAPRISENQVAEMKDLIDDYLADRMNIFPENTPRPKHHYLAHYPHLVLQFGSLIRLWTLRFESKHSYFKECARKLHNFRNVCSTMANKHQMLQAYLSEGSVFRDDVCADRAMEFDIHMFATNVQEALASIGFCEAETMVSNMVTYKGTLYKKGMILVHGVSEDALEFGKIMCIVIHLREKVYFVVQKCQSCVLAHLGLYCISEDNDVACICSDSLLDYHPLQEYRLCSTNVVTLHHAVCLL